MSNTGPNQVPMADEFLVFKALYDELVTKYKALPDDHKHDVFEWTFLHKEDNAWLPRFITNMEYELATGIIPDRVPYGMITYALDDLVKMEQALNRLQGIH